MKKRPLCIICSKTLSADTMKPNKHKRHLKTLHSEYVNKPREFFELKLKSYEKQKSIVKEAIFSSYKVAYKIARFKKPHTNGEELILPAAIKIVETMFGDNPKDVQHQLLAKLRDKFFSIQLEEATNSNKDAHLIVYVRSCVGISIVELKATALALFAILNDYKIQANIEWKNCVGICTDGALCIWTHCMIRREAQAYKEMSPGLNIVLTTVVTNLFCNLYRYGAVHSALLFFCEARWLHLRRVFELRQNRRFSRRRKPTGSRGGLFLLKLSYLVDIFGKLNILNLQLQGVNTHILDTNDKVNAFCRKLELWSRNLKPKNLEMFANADEFIKTYKVEEQHIKVVFITIEHHLAMMTKNLKKYFLADDKLILIHSALLFFCEARWLHLRRVFELRQNRRFSRRRKPTGSRGGLFLLKLSYLVDIFGKLNILNLQLQGVNTHILDTNDKVNAFCRKLELWSRNLKPKNLEMFANADEFIKTYKVEEQHIKVVFITIEHHLAMMTKNLKKYFLADDKLILSY
ncbi:unnamed protein product [Acanthoscelides obtectus]|uniref:Uncharacterized protein n=1 Tax=Acanthoscelides obtectus TaxID=200917 RepID=A0A9P0JWE5_ACAOB|nr:unnamed protein product [Acanthoscelides obtectus]CAK1657126.1 Zinc finger BED domain-containing protein 5 [Acanthoscelides obtectus]